MTLPTSTPAGTDQERDAPWLAVYEDEAAKRGLPPWPAEDPDSGS